MGNAFLHGNSGGTYLNFKVKTYPSETELKEDNPSENTIGVITTTTMTSWVFSATEPTEPAVGMVWISVGTSSSVEFNALKKNGLQVYPLSAKQMVSGALKDVAAKIYQGGSWKIFVEPKYIFKNGEGTVAKLRTATRTTGSQFYVDINNDRIYGHGYNTSNSVTEVLVCTEEKHDLSNYKTLCFDAEIPQIGAGVAFGVTPDPIPANHPNNIAYSARVYFTSAMERTVINVPIDSLDSGYLSVCGASNFNVYNWWLE